jgi:peroxiredoxin (alkyl hydroperoxide reductase subunit C)
LQFHEKHGQVCPAGWQEGRPGMQGSHEGVSQYLKEHEGQL